jgi:hypothetical protein
MLKKSQLQHDKTERKVVKLRVRLERAETKLAQRAQELLLVQAKLHPADEQAEPAVAAHDGAAPPEPAEKSVPVVVASSVAPTNGDAKPASSPRTPKPPRPRGNRRADAGTGASHSPLN